MEMADFSELFRTTEEQLTPLEAKIEGEVPPWLNGHLVRLGPGVFDLKDGFVMCHYFDGYGVLVNFEISNGKITFQKRYVQSDAFKKASSIGKPVFTEFGTKASVDPNKGLFSRLKSSFMPELTDSDSVNLFRIEDSIYVATETNYIRRIDPFSLESKEKVDLGKILGTTWLSSHHFRDDSGASWTVGSSISASGIKYDIVKIPPVADGKAETALKNAAIVANIYPQWKSGICYYHSFAMTQNYVIFIEQPLVIITMKLLTATMKGKCLRDCMEWYSNDSNRFIVVEKSTGKVYPAKIKSKKAFFSLHCVNSYEKDGNFVLDVIAHDSPEIMDKLFLEHLRKSEFDVRDASKASRFVFPICETLNDIPEGENILKIDTIATAVKLEDTLWLEPEDLTTGQGYELPSINTNFLGKPYRYYYASGMYDPGPFRNTLLKVNTETKDIQTWKMDEYSYPGEAYFIPNPGSTDEDDGILLSTVTDVRKDHTDFLLILDAKTMTEIGRAYVDCHIPSLIHSIFLPSDLKIKR